MAATSVSNPLNVHQQDGTEKHSLSATLRSRRNVRHSGRGTVKVIREVEAVSAYFGHPWFHSVMYQRAQRIRHDKHLHAMRH